MKKLLYTLLMVLGLGVHAQDTNYIGPVDAHDTTWSNFYILDTRRLFLNGQELFGSTAGVFQILVGGSNFYGDVYFSGGGVSVLNSTTIQFSAGQTVFTSAYSIAYSGATTNSLSTPLGASNTIAVSTGTNGGLAFVTGASLGFATGTPVYVETDPTWTAASNNYWTLAGNANTTNGTHFIGTTDSQGFDIRANSSRVARFLPTSPVSVILGSANNTNTTGVGVTIGGGDANSIQDGSSYGTIAGGRNNSIQTNCSDATVGGGNGHIIGGTSPSLLPIRSTIAGGFQNKILGNAGHSAVGGGAGNIITGQVAHGVIGGGSANIMEGNSSQTTIGGGNANKIIASNASVIPGGSANEIRSGTTYSVVGGGFGNIINTNATYAGILSGRNNTNDSPNDSTIAGGRANRIGPDNTGSSSFIGGGQNNFANAQYATIAGGGNNTATGTDSVVSGGGGNTAGGGGSSVSGGDNNEAHGAWSSVSGGRGNLASGAHSFIGGGRSNVVSGADSFAAGFQAIASNQGSFVWADHNSNSTYSSHGTNTFNFRASGGVWHNDSQLLDGSGNILLARITNAANGVYGNVFTSSNNVYSTETTQAIYSMTINTAGTVSVIGQTNAARTVSLQIVSPGTIQAVGGAIVGGRGGSILDANCLDSAIIGGSANSVASLGGDGAYSFIGGGNANTISGTRNAIIGGDSCDINGTRTTIAGGLNNDMTGNGSYNFIGGGQNNGGSGNNHCGVLSGQNNDINSTDKSAIASGQNNLIENATGLDFIGGGAENRIYGYHSTIIGSYGNFVYSDLSHVIGAYSMATGGLHQIAIGPGSYSRHSGSIVMSGHSDTPSSTNIVSTTTNQLVASFPGGIGLQTNIAPAGGVNIGGTFQLRGVRQPICLGYFTNVNPTTIVPVGQGDYYIDAGSNTVVRTFDGTTNGYRFTTWSSF